MTTLILPRRRTSRSSARQACIRGTRIPVAVVLDNLAAGLSVAEIITSYPSLGPEDIHAALSYSAEIARERVVTLAALKLASNL